MNKKGAATMILSVLLIVFLIVFLIGWAINTVGRECNSNGDCRENSYCGSDFSCHEFPKIIEESNNLVWPAAILGIAIIISAFIFRRKEKPRYSQELYQ